MAVNRQPDLDRFLSAQAGSYDLALSEIRAGKKESHWMWWVFPQFAGLGTSEVSRRYAIHSKAEAQAFLAHPTLGPRLCEAAAAVMSIGGRSAADIFGSPDDMKLRSCATLFAHVSAPGSVFERLLSQYFGGVPDERTLQLIRAQAGVRPAKPCGK